MSVLVIGDANVDLEIRLPTDDSPGVHGHPEPRLFGGGSAANTAAAVARLGVPCRFVGTVGDDSFGRLAVHSLEEVGVDTSAVTTTRNEPTVTVIVVVPADGDRLIYVWPPSGGAHGSLSSNAAIRALEGAEWLHVSGICLRLSPAREAILGVMTAARARGIPVSFDLNLRLENWGWDEGIRDVVDQAVGSCDVLLGAGADEIGALAGIDDPVEAARSLAADGRVVVARLGADGAVASTGEILVSEPGFDVEVVDTGGAGDAFNAGFIAARLRGADLAETLRWGNAVAALAITAPGARSTPTEGETRTFLQSSLR